MSETATLGNIGILFQTISQKSAKFPFALVDSALLFIRSALVSIGAGLLAFSLTPIARRYLCRRQATLGDMERSGTHQAVPPDETGAQRMNGATFDNRIRHLP